MIISVVCYCKIYRLDYEKMEELMNATDEQLYTLQSNLEDNHSIQNNIQRVPTKTINYWDDVELKSDTNNTDTDLTEIKPVQDYPLVWGEIENGEVPPISFAANCTILKSDTEFIKNEPIKEYWREKECYHENKLEPVHSTNVDEINMNDVQHYTLDWAKVDSCNTNDFDNHLLLSSDDFIENSTVPETYIENKLQCVNSDTERSTSSVEPGIPSMMIIEKVSLENDYDEWKLSPDFIINTSNIISLGNNLVQSEDYINCETSNIPFQEDFSEADEKTIEQDKSSTKKKNSLSLKDTNNKIFDDNNKCKKKDTHANHYKTHKKDFYELHKELLKEKRKNHYEAQKDIYNMKRRDRYKKQREAGLLKKKNNRRKKNRLIAEQADKTFNLKKNQVSNNRRKFKCGNQDVEPRDKKILVKKEKREPLELNHSGKSNKAKKKENKRNRSTCDTNAEKTEHREVKKLKKQTPTHEKTRGTIINNNARRRDCSFRRPKDETIAEKKPNETKKVKKVVNSRYQAKKKEILKKHKQYYEINKKDILRKRKQYYEANRDVILEKARNYYETHKKKSY